MCPVPPCPSTLISMSICIYKYIIRRRHHILGIANGSTEHLGTPPRPNKIVINGNSPTMMVHQQSTLDEITNKVFNELLQRRVDAHSQEFVLSYQPTQKSPEHKHGPQQQQRQSPLQQQQQHEDTITRSDDMNSESSSGVAYRLRSGDVPVPKARTIINTNKQRIGAAVPNAETKRPLIAKWKTGVKLQTTATNSENNG